MTSTAQYRFYTKGASLNTNTLKEFTEDGIEIKNTSKIGVQTLPGTRFKLYINDNDKSTAQTLIVGRTGIFQFEFMKGAYVNGIVVLKESLQNISSTPGAYLLIDVVTDIEDTE